MRSNSIGNRKIRVCRNERNTRNIASRITGITINHSRMLIGMQVKIMPHPMSEKNTVLTIMLESGGSCAANVLKHYFLPASVFSFTDRNHYSRSILRCQLFLFPNSSLNFSGLTKDFSELSSIFTNNC